jgi:hypothetical protein
MTPFSWIDNYASGVAAKHGAAPDPPSVKRDQGGFHPNCHSAAAPVNDQIEPAFHAVIQDSVQVNTNNCPPSVRHTGGGRYPGCLSGFRPGDCRNDALREWSLYFVAQYSALRTRHCFRCNGNRKSFMLVVGRALFAMILAAGFWFGPACALADKDEQHVFSTWEGFEADKCASFWLIKRFVDKDAVFRFFPTGETLKIGTPFDTPDAELRRYHNRSTFQTILARYQLKDPKLLYIARIVHDIEINVWEKKAMPETRSVQEMVNGIIRNARSNEEVIAKSIEFFDALYDKTPAGPR